MTKVILKGRPGCSYDLGVGFIVAGKVVDLCKEELKKAKDSNLINEYIEKPKEKKSVGYTSKELYAMNSAEQTKLLLLFGKKVPRLEKDKVNAILEAQND